MPIYTLCKYPMPSGAAKRGQDFRHQRLWYLNTAPTDYKKFAI